MRSAFVFDPSSVSGGISGKYDVVHVSCVPFLCGLALGEAERLRNAFGSSFSGKFPGNDAWYDISGKSAFFREKLGNDRPLMLLSLPFISRGRAFKLFEERFGEFADVFDGFTLQNIGDYAFLTSLFEAGGKYRKNDFFLAGDTALNVFNSETARFWQGKLDSLAILPELDTDGQKELAARFPEGLVPETVSCGVAPVMRSEHCFAVKGRNFRCGACGKYGLSGGTLEDVKDRSFRIVTNPLDCNSILLGNINAAEPGEEAGNIYRTDVFA